MNDELKVTNDPLMSIPGLQVNTTMELLERYKMELQNELNEILSWWMTRTLDEENGGFVGKIDHSNKLYPDAPKGSVLNSRILWAFSSSFSFTGNKEYLQIAQRAFGYFVDHFIDKEFGGVYWTVDYRGQPLDRKKQIYSLAFAVYALSEYHRCSGDEKAKEMAIEIYRDIAEHSYDPQNGGYIEAFAEDWEESDDLRLSAKDQNEKKSMNTHLHLLEAFANLYKTWKDESLKQRIIELIQIFLDHIVDNETHHQILFFDEKWNSKSSIISYGHDVEAAWLIQEAAERVGNSPLQQQVKKISLNLAEAAAGGIDQDGGLWYEYNPTKKQMISQKHSWPQAEAMVGFFNAWQLTGHQKFLSHSIRSWQFIKQYILDKNLGEWYWGVNADHSPMREQEKVGIWKCPYHNTRACMEVIHRINRTIIIAQ